MNALLFYLFLALFISFICSLVEAILLSIPQSYLMSLESENSWSKSFLSLKKNIDKPLAAILTLNTVAHTIGAAGVGAQVTNIYGDNFLGIASGILTILILFFSEIIPKTIGANYWKGLSKSTYYILKIMLFITYPVVIVSLKITQIFSRDKLTKVTREELSALSNLAYSEGVFSMQENRIIQNIIDLKKIKASEILTPRVVVFLADESLDLDSFSKEKNFSKHTRIPVFTNNIENVTGYVFLQDVIEKMSNKNNNLILKDLKRQILTVPNSVNVFSLFNQFLKEKEHIALIVDEYGGFDGIITMEDIIETLLGLEIIDENDQIVDMQLYAKEKWYKKRDLG
tara:strand:- start:295 stop:1320 length:1026 start_codon:yes stop_codon:yes gene_type:complete